MVLNLAVQCESKMGMYGATLEKTDEPRPQEIFNAKCHHEINHRPYEKFMGSAVWLPVACLFPKLAQNYQKFGKPHFKSWPFCELL